jgi:hypothetical protein
LKQARQTKGFITAARRLLFFALFSLLCSAAALYVLGNRRNFAERTQIFLLNVILYAGLFPAVYILFDFVLAAGPALLKHKQGIPLKSFVLLVFGFAAFIFSGLAAAILVLTGYAA